jgi:hypothetical protein
MSDIPRYRPVSNDRYGITDDADGKLCEYRDYARLKAEVERLTKAGDAMALALAIGDRGEYGGVSDPIEDYLKARKEIKDWNAAKEGKQSK